MNYWISELLDNDYWVSRQRSQPRTNRSQNVSTEAAFLWTQEEQQLREGPNSRQNQWLKKKRSPEETLDDGLHTGERRYQPRGSCSLVQKS